MRQRGVIVTSSADVSDGDFSKRLSVQLRLLGNLITKCPQANDVATNSIASTDNKQSLSSVIRHIAALRRQLKSTSTPPSLQNLCAHLVYNRQYDSRCLPIMRYDHTQSGTWGYFRPHSSSSSSEADRGVLPLLVTGLGGCGSHSLSNTLRGAGYEVRHEGLDRDGAVVSDDDYVLYDAFNWVLRSIILHTLLQSLDKYSLNLSMFFHSQSWLYSANDFSLGRAYPHGPIQGGSSFLAPRCEQTLSLYFVHCGVMIAFLYVASLL